MSGSTVRTVRTGAQRASDVEMKVIGLLHCFVTLGVVLNMSQMGFIFGYTVAIIPQLMHPNSSIPIDEKSGSWIVSLPGIPLAIGNFAAAYIMTKYGRRIANIVTAALSFLGWLLIIFANNVTCILIGRFLQGLPIGLILTLGPVMIGECTSPKYRGVLLTSLSFVMSIAIFTIHVISSYLHWQMVAVICLIINFICVLICLFSPESPTFLADRGKYEDCKKVYRWLRGNEEEQELKYLLETSTAVRDLNSNSKENLTFKLVIRNKIEYLKDIFIKKEVNRPLIITLHFNSITYLCGLPIITSYPIHIIKHVVGIDQNISTVIMSIGITRLLSNFLFMYVVKKFKRKIMIYVTVGANIILLFVIAGFVYLKLNNVIAVGTTIAGLILLHLQIFSISMGALPIPFIISGEIFPSEYRSLTSAISRALSSILLFSVLKTFFVLLKITDIYGIYCIHGVICTYSLIVIALLLPETKDKTLFDIENEFKGVVKLRHTDEVSEVFLKIKPT
ncbi:facilitated trehalose transporter Tret1-like [Aphomia sociella]